MPTSPLFYQIKPLSKTSFHNHLILKIEVFHIRSINIAPGWYSNAIFWYRALANLARILLNIKLLNRCSWVDGTGLGHLCRDKYLGRGVKYTNCTCTSKAFFSMRGMLIQAKVIYTHGKPKDPIPIRLKQNGGGLYSNSRKALTYLHNGPAHFPVNF